MSGMDPSKERKALNLHKEATVIDFHCDTLKEVVEWPRIRAPLTPRRKLGEKSDQGHLDLPRLKEGGVDCQVFAVFCTREPRPQDAALWLLDAFYLALERNSDGIPYPPDGLEDASKVPNITLELVKRDYSDEDIKKILGGNFLRVIEKILH